MAEEIVELSLTIKDLSLLHATYMPFVTSGGLFIPTKRKFQMGANIKINLTLMDDQNKYTVAAQIVWLTPENAHGNKAQGIGIGFKEDKDSRALNEKIVKLIEKVDSSAQPPYTM